LRYPGARDPQQLVVGLTAALHTGRPTRAKYAGFS
jgi:hypothetical protein